jgi:hypothetical protein
MRLLRQKQLVRFPGGWTVLSVLFAFLGFIGFVSSIILAVSFLILPTLIGSSFWLFAVFGAAFGFSRMRTADQATSVTQSDLVVVLIALIVIRALVHGVSLAH